MLSGSATPAVVSPLLLDVNDVAAITQVSPSTVYRLERAGIIPRRRKLGNLVRWSKAEIEQWVLDGSPRVIDAK